MLSMFKMFDQRDIRVGKMAKSNLSTSKMMHIDEVLYVYIVFVGFFVAAPVFSLKLIVTLHPLKTKVNSHFFKLN